MAVVEFLDGGVMSEYRVRGGVGERNGNSDGNERRGNEETSHEDARTLLMMQTLSSGSVIKIGSGCSEVCDGLTSRFLSW